MIKHRAAQVVSLAENFFFKTFSNSSPPSSFVVTPFSHFYFYFSTSIACRGRGRGNILPSWMTAGPGEAPGAPGSGAGSGPIRSVEDALAVLEAHGVKHRSKDKKHKKHKHKKEKKSKHKKEKRRSSGKGERHGKDKRSRSDSDSSSESR